MSLSLLRRSLGVRRWLRADPWEVLEVRAAGAGGGASAGSGGGLEPGLSRQRVRIQRSRLGVLVRRHAIVALGLAIVLEALALLGAVPQLVVVVAPLVLLVATVGWELRRRPSLAAVAQLLDQRLRLFDRLGTALELERRGAGNGGGSPLERRTVAEAAALVEGGASEWRPRAAAAPREWGAAAAALAVLAALVAVAVVPGSGSGAGGSQQAALAPGEGAPAAGKGARNKEALEHYLGGPSTPPPSIHRQIPSGNQIRPAAPRGEGAGKRYTGEAYVTPNEGQPTQGQQGFHFEDPSLAEGPVGVRASGKPQAGGEPKGGAAPAGKAGGGKTAGGGGKGPSGGAGGKQGTGRDAATARNGAPAGAPANPGTHTPARAPASKTSAGAKTGSSQGSPETGSPGGNTAGNGVGGNRTGRSREIEGVQSKGLKLQAGYAPYRSAKGGGAKGKSGERQGSGGKARTGQVEGAAEGDGTFAFVPATGGAVNPAGGGQSLAQSYSAALGWLERLPW